MENWIMMLANKVKKIMSKQTEHDGRFDAIDTALGNVDVQGVLDKIGSAEDSGNDTLFGKFSNIESNEKIYAYSDTFKESLLETPLTLSNPTNTYVIGNSFICKHSGIVKVKLSGHVKFESAYSVAGYIGVMGNYNASSPRSKPVPNILGGALDVIGKPSGTNFNREIASCGAEQVDLLRIPQTLAADFGTDFFVYVSKGMILTILYQGIRDYVTQVDFNNLSIHYDEI